jgi:hypothetical protein
MDHALRVVGTPGQSGKLFAFACHSRDHRDFFQLHDHGLTARYNYQTLLIGWRTVLVIDVWQGF